MEMSFVEILGQIGFALPVALGAIGSAVGISLAGRAAAGAWGAAAKANKPISFTYVVLLAMPLSQTLYGLILMLNLKDLVVGSGANSSYAGVVFGLGLACGLAELFSAWFQGAVGAAACRALSEGGGKGFMQMVIAMGIVETVGIFGFVFPLIVIPS